MRRGVKTTEEILEREKFSMQKCHLMMWPVRQVQHNKTHLRAMHKMIFLQAIIKICSYAGKNHMMQILQTVFKCFSLVFILNRKCFDHTIFSCHQHSMLEL